MAIRLHALATLVLTNFGLTTLFEIAHGLGSFVIFCGFRRPQFRLKWFCLGDDLIERILDDALCA